MYDIIIEYINNLLSSSFCTSAEFASKIIFVVGRILTAIKIIINIIITIIIRWNCLKELERYTLI